MASNKVEIKIDVNTNTKTLEELNKKLGETSAEAKKLGKATEIHASFNGKEIAVAKAEFDELIKKATATGKALDIKAKVDGSGNISMLASDFDELKAKAKQAGEGVSTFSDKVKNIATAAAGLYVVHEAFSAVASAVSSTISRGLEVNATFESMRIGLASLIAAQIDDVNSKGKVLSINEKYAEGMKMSAEAVDLLRKANLDTPATLTQLTAGFQQSLGPALQLGWNIKQTVEYSKLMTQAAGAMGMSMDMIGQEMRSVLEGNIDNNSQVAKALGLTNEQIKLHKQLGDLYPFVTKRLQAFSAAGKDMADSWVGVKSNLEDAFDTAAALTMKEAFDELKKSGLDLAKYLTENAPRIAKEFGGKLAALVQTGRDIVAFFDKWGEKILTVTKYAAELAAVWAFLRVNGAVIMGLARAAEAIGALTALVRGLTTAQAAFNLVAKANPYLWAASAIVGIATAFGLFGDKAEEAGDKAKKAVTDTGKAADDAATVTTGANANITKSAEELKEKLKGYTEERRVSHEKTLEGLKKKELELKDSIEKTQKELAESLKKLETERIERQRDLSVKAREIDRGMMDNAKAYMDRLKQSDEEYYLAKEALKKKDLETYKKHMAEYLRLATDGAGKAVEVEGKVIYTKEQTATVAKEAIKKTQALENEYYALKKAQEIAAHNQKIELIQAELSATKTKIQAELAQLAIFSKIYEALTGKSIDIKIDTAQGQAALTALDTQYKNLENQKIKIDLDTAKAESAIKKTEAAAKKGATIDIEADTDKANKDLKSLKEENSSIVIEIQGEAEALKKDIESFKQPTESKHTITGQVKNKSDLDALKKDTNSTHTVYVKTVQTRQSGGEIFDIGRARGLESGGALSGYGGGDTVPAMLEPGEFVVRKEAVARYGFALMHNLNSLSLEPQIRKYAVGGLVLGEADSAFIKDKASSSSSSSSYSSSSDPVEVKLTLANPPFNASVPDYQALVSELAKLSSTITQLKPSGSDFMSLETADKISKLEAEQTAIKETYKTNENNFRKTLKEQSKQYVTSLKASQSQIGSSVVNIPQINPAATGEDDEVQGYVDDAKDAYQDALENARDAIMNMVEPYTKYGATGPDISGIMDLGTLSRKALEVKQKVDSLKGRDFSVLEDRQGFIQKYIYEHSPNPYDMTVHYLPSNAYDYQTVAYGRHLTPFEAADMQATANAAQLKAALRFQVGGDVPNLSSGAKLSGYGGGDIVPAYLEPGEFVVRKEATAHYGSDVLHAINNLSFKTPSVLKFQSGGVVPGTNSASRITKDVTINIKGDRGENMQLLGDDATAKALESYLRRRV